MADHLELDVLIVGAGLAGIAFAKFYLDVHPQCRLLMVDRDTCPGGSWNARRLYPHFWSQTGIDMAEFSDLPMAISPSESTQYSMTRGKCITQYLENYLGVHTYNGATLRERFRPAVDVKSMERENGFWKVQASGADGANVTFLASKLVVATGLTSTPNVPELPDKAAFEGPIIHQEGFGSSPVLSADSIESVAVVGGGKSAADMVYACGKAGKKVHWLIREDGTGPPSFVDIEGYRNYRNSPEFGSTRLVGSASPSPFAPENTRTRFMGRTVLGRSLMGSVWSPIDKQSLVYFQSDAMAREDLQQLRSTASVFWNKSPPALVQHGDFFTVLAASTTVHRASIQSMATRSIELSSGDTIDCHAVLLGTGWKESHYTPFTESQRSELGLPHSLATQSPSESAMWSYQHEDAYIRLRKKWPAVMNPPPYPRVKVSTTPYRLYKLIAPLNDPDHSIVFLGLASVANHFRTAEAQAIWATGYLDHRLSLPSLENQRREIAQCNVWCRRRYLNKGVLGNYLYYDWVGYSDALLDEAGLLSTMRGKRSAWHWWTRPNLARDLYVAREAYLEKYEGRPRQRVVSTHSWGNVKDSAEVDTITTKRSFSIISWGS